MPKYAIEVHLHISSSAEIELEAATEDEAHAKAEELLNELDTPLDYFDWQEQDITNEVYSVTEIEED